MSEYYGQAEQNGEWKQGQNRLKEKSSKSRLIFKKIKQLIQQMDKQKVEISLRMKEEKIEREEGGRLQNMSIQKQLIYTKQMLESRERKIKESEQQWEKVVKEQQQKHRKQIKKYLDIINEKQLDIENQRKNIKALTNKNITLSQQIQSLLNVKVQLENTIAKWIQGIKTSVKQFNYNIQESQLDKVVLQGKYKQLCDKIELLVKQLHELQVQKSKVEARYDHLRQAYQEGRCESMENRFQIQKMKMKLQELREKNKQKNELEKEKNMQQEKRVEMQELQNIKLRGESLIKKIGQWGQVKQQLQKVWDISNKLNQMVNQNEKLKVELYEKQHMIDNLEVKLQGRGHEDQILKERNMSLYQKLVRKRNQIQIFEAKIQQIQRVAYIAEDLLRRKFEPFINTQVNTESAFPTAEKQSRGNKYTKQELYQEFQQEKKIAIAHQRENYEIALGKEKETIRQLQEQNISLRKQNQKLRSNCQQAQRQKKKLKSIIDEILDENQAKRKKGKTKAKTKCVTCSAEFNNNCKVHRCSECLQKVHQDCIKNHQCRQRLSQYSDLQCRQL